MEPILTIANSAVISSFFIIYSIFLRSESVYIIRKAWSSKLFFFDGSVNAPIVFPCTFLGYFYYFGEGISARGCVYC